MEPAAASTRIGVDGLMPARPYHLLIATAAAVTDSEMSLSPTTSADAKLHKLQQAVKWLVYTLLIINFVFYVIEDSQRAIHTLHA
jgi:hypothetical protein